MGCDQGVALKSPQMIVGWDDEGVIASMTWFLVTVD